MTQRGELEEWAGLVSDGAEIDWDRVRAQIQDPSTVENLLVVKEIIRFHRSADGDRQVQRRGAVSGRWGSLELEEKIGEGTFGVIYRAWEPTLERHVALKLLRPRESGTDLGVLVLREGRNLAKIRHPNVVQVFGAAEHQGQVGLWMELIKGQTLDEAVRRQGRLSAFEAARIGIDLCRALSAFHARKLIHRDVKAQNVIREDGGRIVLMDLGLGADISTRDPFEPAGTPLYMAPELLEGAPPSEASDVYSLGILLFYLVSGEFPTCSRPRSKPAESMERPGGQQLIELRPDLPGGFIDAIEKAIEPIPAQRAQTPWELEKSLRNVVMGRNQPPGFGKRWIAILVGAVALALLALIAWYANPSAPRSEFHSIAVLPFEIQGADPGQEYLADGLPYDLSHRLARFTDLRVVSSAVSRGRLVGVPPSQPARSLGVDALVLGTLRRRADRLRLSVEVINPIDGSVLWGNEYQEASGNWSVIIDLAARAIHDAVHPDDPEGDRRDPLISTDPKAYEHLLRGRHHFSRRTRDGLQKAIHEFRAAIVIDPTLTEAHTGLAHCLILSGSVHYGDASLSRAEAVAMARESIEQALRIDQRSAEAYTALGFIQFWYDWDWGQAEDSFQRAILLNPSYHLAHQWYADLLAISGRFDEAEKAIRLAVTLAPLSLVTSNALGTHLYYAGRYQEALEVYRKILDLDPYFSRTLIHIGACHLVMENWEEAIDALQKAQSLAGGKEVLPDLIHAFARSGNRNEALRLLDQARSQGSLLPLHEALIWGELGQLDKAFAALQQAVDNRDQILDWMALEPRMDSLRSDPRFSKLVKEMRLPWTRPG